jgi:hypothetical protein
MTTTFLRRERETRLQKKTQTGKKAITHVPNILLKRKCIWLTLFIATSILLPLKIFNVFFAFLRIFTGMTVVPTLSISRQQDQHAFSRHDQAKKQKNERVLMICNFRQNLFEDIVLTCPERKFVATSNTVCTVVYVKKNFFSCNQSIYNRNNYYRRG